MPDEGKDLIPIPKEEYEKLNRVVENHEELLAQYNELKMKCGEMQDNFKSREQNLHASYEKKHEELSANFMIEIENLKAQMGMQKSDKSEKADRAIEKNKSQKKDSRENLKKDKDLESNSTSDSENLSSSSKKLSRKKNTRKNEKSDKKEKYNMTVDSMYGLSPESSSEDSLTDKNQKYKTRGMRLVTQIPKVEPFTNKRGQDVRKFFDEYEEYCNQCYCGRKNLWIKGLKDSLGGTMLDSFLAMTADSGINMRYETVKRRLIDQADRMKKTAYHDKRRDFDRIKMKPNESLWAYAFRLETAAIEKFGDDFLDDGDVEIFRKFLDTVPEEIRVQVNKQRKLRKRLGADRYSWYDLRQDLEEEVFEKGKHESSQNEVSVKTAMGDSKVFKSYSEALMASQSNDETGVFYMVKATFDEAKKQTELLQKLTQDRGRSVGRENRNRTHPRSRSQSRRSGRQENPSSPTGPKKCTYCQILGHEWQECRTRLGQCYRCGVKGHFKAECNQQTPENSSGKTTYKPENSPSQVLKCQFCDGMGHTAKDCEKIKGKQQAMPSEN